MPKFVGQRLGRAGSHIDGLLLGSNQIAVSESRQGRGVRQHLPKDERNGIAVQILFGALLELG